MYTRTRPLGHCYGSRIPHTQIVIRPIAFLVGLIILILEAPCSKPPSNHTGARSRVGISLLAPFLFFVFIPCVMLCHRLLVENFDLATTDLKHILGAGLLV